MGFFDSFTKEGRDAAALKEFQEFLIEGEEIKYFSSAIVESYVITNHRILVKDLNFKLDDSQSAIFSIEPSKITALSVSNKLFTSGLTAKKYHLGIHVGGLTVSISFKDREECQSAYKVLSSLVYLK